MTLTWEPAGGLGDMRSCKMEVGSLSLHSQVNYEMQSIELLLVYRPKVDSRKSGSGWWWCYFRQPVSLQFSWSLSFFLGDHYSMIPQWLPLSQVFCSRQKKKEKRLGKEPTTFVHFCGIGKFSGPLWTLFIYYWPDQWHMITPGYLGRRKYTYSGRGKEKIRKP